MREILFRGKRKGDEEWEQEWIFGDLMQIPTHNFCSIIEQTACAENCEVIPATVGQYTGLTDKNGKKIFEGDILKDTDCFNRVELWCVEYRLSSFHTRIFTDAGLSKYPVPIDDVDIGVPVEEFEIIGNIHDNPELLKGGSE